MLEEEKDHEKEVPLKEQSNGGQNSSEEESEMELGDEDSPSCSSSAEESGSEQRDENGEEEEEDEEGEEENDDSEANENASSSGDSSDDDSSESSSETNGGPTLQPVYGSHFQSGQRESAEPLTGLVGSFKVTDPDMGLAPSFGNLSPSFDSKGSLAGDNNLVVDQDMNPVVDFPDTDSTALIKELSAEVFSIEAPETSGLDQQRLSDDD